MREPSIRQLLKSIEQRRRHRECGPCTACCTVMGVLELGKPYNVPCEHVCQGGCAIYKDRPRTCRSWECQWRCGFVEGMQETRPDNLGAMLEWNPHVAAIEVWLLRQVSDDKMAKIRRIADELFSFHEKTGLATHMVMDPPNIDVPIGYSVDRDKYPIGGAATERLDGVIERGQKIVTLETYSLVPTTAA
jgi:hypothetical protein